MKRADAHQTNFLFTLMRTHGARARVFDKQPTGRPSPSGASASAVLSKALEGRNGAETNVTFLYSSETGFKGAVLCCAVSYMMGEGEVHVRLASAESSLSEERKEFGIRTLLAACITRNQ